MAGLLFVALAVVALLSGSQASVTVVRNDFPENVARTQAQNPECTSIFNVLLEARYSTQGNDVAMTETHGRDTRVPQNDPRYANFNDLPGVVVGADWRDHPFPRNAAKQANARSQFSVTALTEDTGRPMGFWRAVSRMHYSVCVSVSNTKNRWIEIMAETLQPDQQICVTDWNRPNLADNPFQEACGNGNLYTCRESPAESDSVSGFRFYCRDSCDDPDFDFYWRIVGSQLPSLNGAQPDGENWCSMRDGDDYPSSLLEPYPEQYDAPPVFQRGRGAASATVASALTLVALAALRYLF